MKKSLRNTIEKIYSMRVKDIMDRWAWDIPVLSEDDTVIHALFMLRSNNHIWIVNNEKEMKVVGVIERVDVLRAILPPEAVSYAYSSTRMAARNIYMREDASVGDVMSSPVITASEEMTLKDAMVKMHRYNVERLPVVDKNGKLEGEVTLKSILIALTRDYKERK